MNDNNIKALVWDLDGTIIHFRIDFLKARREAIKILTTNGVPKKFLTIKRSILDNIRFSTDYLKEQGSDSSEIRQIIDKVDQRVSEIEYEAALEAERIPNIEKVLEFAKNILLKQAIYTYNTRNNATVSLNKVNLLEYFDVIIGRDNVQNPKPHKDHLLSICKSLAIYPSECIIIGDTSRDIEGALNLSARSIAIKTKTSGFSDPDTFQKADIIVDQKHIPDKLIGAINTILQMNKKT